MRHCVVTGGNRGLGFEFTRQLLQRGDRVVAGCRHPGRALALNELTAAFPNHLHVLPLDLQRDASIDEFVREAGTLFERLDLLINNAGVLPSGERFGALAAATLDSAFRINAAGPLLLTERLAERLAPAAVVANISTTIGSIAQTRQFRTPSYAISKAALNMVTRLLAAALADRATVVALHPGWVRTDMGGERAPLTASDAVQHLLARIDALSPADSGLFVDADGHALPW